MVIPTKWVYQNERQWEKFVNIGLNTNQTHRVFYTENQLAYDQSGVPLSDFEVNFDLNATTFPEEGCYDGKLIKFYGELQ